MTFLLDAHFQKTNFTIAMTFSTWIFVEQITYKINVTVFIFFNYDKSYKPKSRTIFFVHTPYFVIHSWDRVIESVK